MTVYVNGDIYSKDKKLKREYNRAGFPTVTVRTDTVANGSTTLFVHKLVATAFIPNPNNYKYVLFIDGNKTNLSLNNLKWVSHTGMEAEKKRLEQKRATITHYKTHENINKHVLLFKDGEYIHTFNSIVECAGYLQVVENKLQYKFSSIRKYVLSARQRNEPLWGHYTFVLEKDLPPDSDLLRVTE